MALGGGIGAAIRYGLASRWGTSGTSDFPWTTLLINLAGSFLLGLLVTLLLEHWPPTRYARPFFGIGLLGGFTTFSTFAVETVRMAESGDAGLALLYIGVSFVGGVAAVITGVRIADLRPRLAKGSR